MDLTLDQISVQLGSLNLSTTPASDPTSQVVSPTTLSSGNKTRTRPALLEKNGQAFLSKKFSINVKRLESPPPRSIPNAPVKAKESMSLIPRRRGKSTRSKSKVESYKRKLTFNNVSGTAKEGQSSELMEAEVEVENKRALANKKIKPSAEEEVKNSQDSEDEAFYHVTTSFKPVPMVAQYAAILEQDEQDDEDDGFGDYNNTIIEEELLEAALSPGCFRTTENKPKQRVHFSDSVKVFELQDEGESRGCSDWHKNLTKAGMARAALWPQELALAEQTTIFRKVTAKTITTDNTTMISEPPRRKPFPGYAQRLLNPPHLNATQEQRFKV